MNRNSATKLFVAAGVLCFVLAFAMLSAFKGRFGADTAGISSVPYMEEPLEVVPQKRAQSTGTTAEDAAPRRVRSVSQSETAEAESRWMVYVTGAVKKPGVYEVAPGARVYEALNAAGGFADGADQDAVNLAAKLSDGEHVRFPRRGEQRQENVPSRSSGADGASASSSGTARVNINTADKAGLRSIRGIGAKTAQLILDYRKENGPFGRTEDLMNVSGIGPKRYEEIKDQITVGN